MPRASMLLGSRRLCRGRVALGSTQTMQSEHLLDAQGVHVAWKQAAVPRQSGSR